MTTSIDHLCLTDEESGIQNHIMLDHETDNIDILLFSPSGYEHTLTIPPGDKYTNKMARRLGEYPFAKYALSLARRWIEKNPELEEYSHLVLEP